MSKCVPGLEARPCTPTMRARSTNSMRKILIGGLTVSLSLGLLVTSGPAAKADPPIPSQSDVQRAQQAAQNKAGQVNAIEARLAAAQTNLQTLQIAEDVAGQKYIAATLKLQRAKAVLVSRQRSATVARTAVQKAQGQVGEMARSAMQGQAGLLAWAPIFNGGTPQQIINQAGSFNSYSTVMRGRYLQLQVARTKATEAEANALAASKIVQTATDNAKATKTAADTAAQSEQSAVNGYAQRRSSLITELAAAQRTSVVVAKQRQDGLEAQARARRIAAAKAAAAAQQRRELAAAKAAAAVRAAAAKKASDARLAAAKQAAAARATAARQAEAARATAAKKAEVARVAAKRKAEAAAQLRAADRAATRAAARSASASKAKAARHAAEKRSRSAAKAAAETARAAAETARAAVASARQATAAKANERSANAAIAALSAKPFSASSSSWSHRSTSVKSSAKSKTSHHRTQLSSGSSSSSTRTRSSSSRSSSSGSSSSYSSGYTAGGAQAAIAFARRQLGKPYVFGATGPSTFDCSGLTLRSWEHGGREIPRLAADQYIAIKHISISQLRAGDLVFWGGASPSSIYHVAIYIGGGQIIQAPRPGKNVEVSGLYDWITPNYIGRV